MSSRTLTAQIKQRIDTTAGWAAQVSNNNDPVLANGEIGLEKLTDGTVKMKIGDGSSGWSNLSYVTVSYTTTSNNNGTTITIGPVIAAPAAGGNA